MELGCKVLIEIPQGTKNNKYERNPKTGEIVLDFVFENLVWPFNYGEIIGTKGGDGDRLDAVVYSSEPLAQGAIINCRPFGVALMIDRGEVDDKLLLVPEGDLLAKKYADIKDFSLAERHAFDLLYKDIARQKKKAVEFKGFEGREFSCRLIEQSRVAEA